MIRRPPTLATGGMIAASHPLAAEAGASMLRAGGHAVDAVIAAGAVLAVVEPSASGIGGDAFFLLFDRKDQAVSAINGNGAAPARLTREVFRDDLAIPARSPLAATVPGCVSAWEEARYGWGRLEWADLLQPALDLAREGFPVSWRMARILRREVEVLRGDPGLSAVFLDSGGSALQAGDLCRPEALARTLEVLAEEGPESLYTGEIAETLCRGARESGGVLGPEDLAGQEASLLQPIEFGLEDRLICEQPLPTQGILLPVMLGMLARARPGAAWEEVHRQLQAARIALALRQALLTDPAFLPVGADVLTETLLDGRTLAGLSRLLDEEPLPPSLAREVVLQALDRSGPSGRDLLRAYRSAGFLGGDARQPDPGSDTTYLCAVDGEGNAAGLIQSIFHPFGCGYLEPATGIILNNRVSAFSLDPREVNRLEPGKRTMHTLNSYLILREGLPWMVGGTPGADQQVQTNLQVLRHLLAGRPLRPGPEPMAPEKWTQARRDPVAPRRIPESELLPSALEAPRWSVHPEGRITLEGRFPSEVRKHLRRAGHDPVRIGPWEGSGQVQAIRFLEGGVLLGATDPRGEGLVVGF